jgi:hypothetical protein
MASSLWILRFRPPLYRQASRYVRSSATFAALHVVRGKVGLYSNYLLFFTRLPQGVHVLAALHVASSQGTQTTHQRGDAVTLIQSCSASLMHFENNPIRRAPSPCLPAARACCFTLEHKTPSPYSCCCNFCGSRMLSTLKIYWLTEFHLTESEPTGQLQAQL